MHLGPFEQLLKGLLAAQGVQSRTFVEAGFPLLHGMVVIVGGVQVPLHMVRGSAPIDPKLSVEELDALATNVARLEKAGPAPRSQVTAVQARAAEALVKQTLVAAELEQVVAVGEKVNGTGVKVKFVDGAEIYTAAVER